MYDYTNHRSFIYTEKGFEMLLKIRDKATRLLETAGAFQEEHVYSGITGDSWDMLACVDYLVERGDIRRIYEGPHVARQHNVYVRN